MQSRRHSLLAGLRRFFAALCVATAALGVGRPGLAASSSIGPDLASPAAPAPAGLAVGTQPDAVTTFTLPSSARATPYLIQVWAPQQPAPEAGWPVVYVLDGNVAFENLLRAGAQHAHAPGVPAIVVGVGYADTRRFNREGRSYDYTPPSPGDDDPVGSPRDPQARGVSLPGGGAEKFLAFLRTQVEPEIEKRYAVNPARRTLFGHSYGGLFVLYAYFTAPAAFDAFVAASPSLWWNDRYIEQLADRFLRHPPATAGALSLWVGGNEIQGKPEQETAIGLAQRLTDRTSLQVDSRVYPGLGHGPMSPAALNDVLMRQTSR